MSISTVDLESVIPAHRISSHGTAEKEIEPSAGNPEKSTSSEYPEGGLQGWLTIAGAWLVQFASFGNLYSFGVYQDFYTRVYLKNFTPSQIGWIGSVQLMMPFLMSAISGPLYDRGYFHALEITGAIIYVFSIFMLSLAKPFQYYQIFLSQSVGMGLGLGLMFLPAASIGTQYFHKRRAFAQGIVISGSAAGGLIFPIMFNHLLPTHTFGDSVRATGYLILGALIIGNTLMRTRLPGRARSQPPNIREFFHEPTFLLTIVVAILTFLAGFIPSFYMQLYAVTQRLDDTLAFYSLAIINGASFFGRVGGTYLADHWGRFNVYTIILLILGISIWLMLVIKNTVGLIFISLLYGCFSGGQLGLGIALCTSLAKHPADIGAKVGIILGFSSIAMLVSSPIAGALLTDEFHWIRPVAFAGSMMVAAGFLNVIARNLVAKEKGKWNV